MTLSEADKIILDQIKDLAEQLWFNEGMDCPDTSLVEDLQEAEVENEELKYLLDLTVSGPNSTDVFLPTGELIGDLDWEEINLTENEVWEENRLEFQDRRIMWINGFGGLKPDYFTRTSF